MRRVSMVDSGSGGTLSIAGVSSSSRSSKSSKSYESVDINILRYYRASKLNPSLRPNPSLKRMLHFRHFRDKVGIIDQFSWCIASSDNDVKGRLAIARGADFFQDFSDRQHFVA